MTHDVLDESIAAGCSEFYDSMRFLYDGGFAKHCQNQFYHPLRETKFGTAGYMIWDMGAIEYATFERTEIQRKLVKPLVDFGLALGHAVVQESFLHCLGHQVDCHPEFAVPKIQAILCRNDLQAEIRDYAMECASGTIL